MLTYRINSKDITNDIYIPKYYDPELKSEINNISSSHVLMSIQELIDDGTILVSTGDEIGKMAYGTGSIPFVRTSDISNWEIKTIPKQGISEEVFNLYSEKQDVQEGDILLVRDGAYLIGTNCIITELDLPMLYQSHILKIRINDKDKINPYLFFLSINCDIVQRQIRNIQFTADIIDTLGNRYKELILPIPKNEKVKTQLINETVKAIDLRIKSKAAIKQFPLLIEQVLSSGNVSVMDDFFGKSIDELKHEVVQDTTTLEFGDTVTFKISSVDIVNNIYLPKYYDPTIYEVLNELEDKCRLVSIGELVEDGVLDLATGDEIGKMAYGTGEIPFVRTSDFSNWEIKSDAKQGISEEIYELYNEKEDITENDILLVRDGTYLVGTSCIITGGDVKMLYCGGLYKIRSLKQDQLNPFLLLGLLNSYIVKRQIRTKQFTRDVIDTLGRRILEVVLPIPKNIEVAEHIAKKIEEIVISRIVAMDKIVKLTERLIKDR